MTNDDVVLKTKNLKKYFPVSKGFLQSLLSAEEKYVHAVDDISFTITKGETFGIVGESGCGKTTVGLSVLRLIDSEGEIFFKGQNLSKLTKKELNKLRKDFQIIFQNPYESLSPRFTVKDIVAEPLRLLNVLSKEDEIHQKVINELNNVGLVPAEDFLHRYPHELSGGQRQRVSVARAFVIDPEFIVADEPVSMLDVSIRVGILETMKNVAEKKGTAFILITHDLALARVMCDRIGVMYLGRIVEKGPTEAIIGSPLHPYTQALITAVPKPDPDATRTEELPIKGEVPSGINIPSGCRFRPRCPYAIEKCAEIDPSLEKANENHYVACIRYKEI